MNSGMIGKIEKAHRYAQEPRRVQVQTFAATFTGSHDEYQVSLADGAWTCTCHTFEAHVLDSCPHVMAIQQMLGPMLTEDARFFHHETTVPA